MSIIYDALKKIENKKGSKFNTHNKKINTKSFFIFILFIMVGFFLANFLFNLFNNLLVQKKNIYKTTDEKAIQIEEKETNIKEEPKILPETKKSSTLPHLNGIFYDADNPYVLINNRILKKGECIKEYCVKEIFSDKVRLEKEGEVIELKIKD